MKFELKLELENTLQILLIFTITEITHGQETNEFCKNEIPTMEYKEQVMEYRKVFLENNEIKIDLDENLTPVDNANRYYQLYKKSKAANEHASLLLEETNSQILFYEELDFYTKNAETVAELQEIWAEINNEIVVEKEIQQKIEDKLSEEMLEGKLVAGKKYICTVENGNYSFGETT